MEDGAGFQWSDRYLLGYAPMDEVHREFVIRVDDLLQADEAGLGAALAAFAAHAEAHFEQERRWMEATDFPPRDCHIEEHDKVLASVHEVQEELAAGNVALVRELAKALMDWFPGHADYMDSALATWIVKQAHGGAPLIFRRS